MGPPLLAVKHLRLHFPLRAGLFHQAGKVHAVNDVSFTLHAGETLGIVGESGCGKSTLAKALLGLHRPSAGAVFFAGKDISTFDRRGVLAFRRQMQIVFQDPFESLNSRHSVGQILTEPFIIHRLGTVVERKRWAHELLERVGLAANAFDLYPHQLSGGQRQRISIARAIALQPKLVVCDEPVSALDVSVRAQIANLLLQLQREMNLALIFIAHDLALVRHVSDRVAVMYLGDIVETAAAEHIYERPQHPYTQALIAAIPVADPSRRRARRIVPGDVPSPINPPSGCAFQTRCVHANDSCKRDKPSLKEIAADQGAQHKVACHYSERTREAWQETLGTRGGGGS